MYSTTVQLLRRRLKRSAFIFQPIMSGVMKYWREAATLIIAARSQAPLSGYLGSKRLTFDYKILMLQRTPKGSFFPSAQVYPGGQIDKADFSPEWLDIFKKHGNVHNTTDFGRMVNVQGMRPPMLVHDHQSPVPIDVAYRICAIRETFEESGILLVRDGSNTSNSPDTVPLGSCVKQSTLDLKHWRKQVHDDPQCFMSLCRELGGVPDIWSLAEWSNWLTPSDMTRTRFDTMFYISCLDSIPETLEDKTEIVQSKWVSPLESLQMFADRKTFLPPPQIYEFRRLLRFERFNSLHEFCERRAFQGVERYLPVRTNVDDGVISLLPGDVLYPTQPPLDSNKDHVHQIETTVDEARKADGPMNRFIFWSPTACDLVSTTPPSCDHVCPVTEHVPPTQSGESKL